MAQYHLSLADFEEDRIVVADANSTASKRSLARTIAIYTRCTSLTNRQGEIAFRGKASAADYANKLYYQLSRVATAHGEIGPRDPGRDLWRLYFWNGFIDAVAERFARLDTNMTSAKAPDSEAPPKRTKPAAAREQEPVREEVAVSVENEIRQAASNFSVYFYPPDWERAVSHFCRSAYQAGMSSGMDAEFPSRETGASHFIMGKVSQ